MNSKFDEVINRYNTNCAKWGEAAEKQGADLIHLAVADMDFKSPEPIIQSLQKVVDHGVFGYTVFNSNYYTVIQNWMQRRFNWEIEKDWIVFCPRISEAFALAIQSFTQESDAVIIQSPGYGAIRESVLKNHRRLIVNPLKLEDGRYKMDLQSLEQNMDSSVKLFILCSPHNPVGRVWSKEELLEVGEFCIQHDLILISDEIHCDLLYKGYKHTPLAAISKEIQQRTIVCTSITKTFNVPGIIVSNLIIPNDGIRESIKKAIDAAGMHNPTIFSVPMVEAAYTQCDEWLEEVVEYIGGNYNYFQSYVEENMPKLKIIKPEGTYLVWIDCRDMNLSEEELQDWFMNKAKVAVYLGAVFGKEGKGFIRMNLATTKINLETALHRMKRVYDEK